tara:strand:+ start:2049 stop:2852 length:804 start_codon:yes stop_codon:yes gene_type:complete
MYSNPIEGDSFLVMCDVLNVDGTPHVSNHRAPLVEMMMANKDDPWFGMEQEYTLFKDGRPYGWPKEEEPDAQGDYYCGRNKGEEIARMHLDACISAGISINGINSEVMLGQWEYQIGAVDPLKVSDDLWIARWILEKISSHYDATVSLDPKPMKGDWNGAGCHTNFSTTEMRAEGGIYAIHRAIEKLKARHEDHVSVYGEGNSRRLTGDHETCSINEFKAGVSDRGCSIRIPWQVERDKKGYLEDRRPAANCDPYIVCERLIKTICT